MTMYADPEGAARIARIAKTFDWTWTLADVPRLCDLTGWRMERTNALGLVLTTDLDVKRRIAYVFTDRGTAPALTAMGHEIEDVSVCVADLTAGPQPPTKADVSDRYLVVRERLVAELGTPSRQTHGKRPETLWEYANVLVGVLALDNAVDLGFTNPAYQEWEDGLGSDS